MPRKFRVISGQFAVCLLLAFGAPGLPGAMAAVPAGTAKTAMATIVDGKARLLRGADVLTLREGVPLVAADIVETDERTHVQVEFADGTTLGVGPKTMLHLSALPIGGERAGDIVLQSGWLKLSGSPTAAGVRVVSPSVTVQPRAAAFVLHSAVPVVEIFVESGKISAVPGGGPAAAAQAMKAGDFAVMKADHTLEVTGRPATGFLAALPRTFIETLPARLPTMAARPNGPVLERSVEFAEAARWLKTPAADRKALLRRFAVLLKDKDFRARVDSSLADFPEWDRQLHPEKFVTKTSQP